MKLIGPPVAMPGVHSCEIVGDALAYRLQVQGASASELAPMLTGIGARPDWRALLQRGVISADNLCARRSDVPDSEQYVDLTDGVTSLVSGGAGAVRGPVYQINPELLIPQSLHLLLAQQWARTGAMPLHGAALTTPAGGVLILGPQSGGKSVLSLAALAAGIDLVSDDWLVFGVDTDGQLQSERLRNFMMMRDGPVSDRLMAAVPEIQFQSLPQRGKKVHNIDTASPRFPVSAQIKHCWMLKAPATPRPQRSALTTVEPGALLAALIEASMPLLFSSRFPLEHSALMNSARCLLSQTRCRTLETGIDLVDDPCEALDRLLSEATI